MLIAQAPGENEDKEGKMFIGPSGKVIDESFKSKMVNDYKKLKILSQDCKWYQVCPMKFFYEKGKLDKKWIELYCKGNWQDCVRFYNEENN